MKNTPGGGANPNFDARSRVPALFSAGLDRAPFAIARRIPLECSLTPAMTDSSARIVLGSDHAGYRLKESIRKYLQAAGYTVDDVGPDSEASVDYPDFGAAAGRRVAGGQNDFGIVICGTGIGISIAANKIAGIRAALVADPETARLAREHNDANVLALAGRSLSDDRAISIVQEFLRTPFAGGRHERRVEKIALLDRAREQSR